MGHTPREEQERRLAADETDRSVEVSF